MIIYKAINKINNKVYIGQTVNSLNIRKNQHERSHKYGYKNAFSNAIAKYGKESFEWEVIYETNSIDDLNKKESYFIKYYKALVNERGYNLKGGGRNDFLTL